VESDVRDAGTVGGAKTGNSSRHHRRATEPARHTDGFDTAPLTLTLVIVVLVIVYRVANA
jgi:hypothetical protein